MLKVQVAVLPKWTFSYELHPFPYLDGAGGRWTFPACLESDFAQRLSSSEGREDRALVVSTEEAARRLKAAHPTVRFLFPCKETQVEIHDRAYFINFFEVVEA